MSLELYVLEMSFVGCVSLVYGGEEIEILLIFVFEVDVVIFVVKDGLLRVVVMVDVCEVGIVVLILVVIVVVGAVFVLVTSSTVIGEFVVDKVVFNVVLFVVMI